LNELLAIGEEKLVFLSFSCFHANNTSFVIKQGGSFPSRLFNGLHTASHSLSATEFLDVFCSAKRRATLKTES
jgi:hypothetical protein